MDTLTMGNGLTGSGEPTFVGTGRRLLVEGLVGLFEEVRQGTPPVWVSMEAATGSGKTRIIREFYSALAAGYQRDPPYWPAAIIDDRRVAEGRVADRRKDVHPYHFSRPGESLPDWMWWGVAATDSLAANFEHAFEGHRLFYEATWRSVAAAARSGRLGRAGRKAGEVLAGEALEKAIETVLGSVPGVGLAIEAAKGTAKGVRERSERRAAVAAPSLFDSEDNGSLVDETARLLIRLAQPGFPLVIAVEDLHAASQGVSAVLRRCLESESPILVVSTALSGHLGAEWVPNPVHGARHVTVRGGETSAGGLLPAGAGLTELSTVDLAVIVRRYFPLIDEFSMGLLIERFSPSPLALEVACETLTETIEPPITAEQIAAMPRTLERQYRKVWSQLPKTIQRGLVLAAWATPPGINDTVGGRQIQWHQGLLEAATIRVFGDTGVFVGELAAAEGTLGWHRLEDSDRGLFRFNELLQWEVATSDPEDVFYGLPDSKSSIRAALSEELRPSEWRTHLPERYWARVMLALYASGRVEDTKVVTEALLVILPELWAAGDLREMGRLLPFTEEMTETGEGPLGEKAAHLFLWLARYNQADRKSEESISCALRGLALLTESDSGSLRGRLLAIASAGHWRRHRYQLAARFAIEALTVGVASDDSTVQVSALKQLGVVENRLGRYHGAQLYFDEAHRIIDERPELEPLRSSIVNNEAVTAGRSGDHARGAALYAQAIEHAAAAGNTNRIALYNSNLGQALTRLGFYDAAREALERSAQIASHLGVTSRRLTAEQALARLAHYSGDAETAAHAYRQLLTTGTRMGCLLGLAAATLEHPTASLEDLQSALDAARKVADSVSSAVAEVQEIIDGDTAAELLRIRMEKHQEGLPAHQDLGSRPEAIDSGAPLPRLVPSVNETWWTRYQRAFRLAVRSQAGTVPSWLTESALRLALAKCSSPGVVDAARRVMAIIEDGTSAGHLPGLVAVISPGAGPSPVNEELKERLDYLARKAREATRGLRTVRRRTPSNLGTERRLVDEAWRRGEQYEPRFEYPSMDPPDLDAVWHFLEEVDPSEHEWIEHLVMGVEDAAAMAVALHGRDPRAITAASAVMFGEVEEHVVQDAEAIVFGEHEPEDDGGATLTGPDLAERTREVLAELGLSWSVEVVEQLAARFAVRPLSRVLRVRRGASFSEMEAVRLLVHEVGTHVARAENARSDGNAFLARPVGRHLEAEEGLAVFHEKSLGILDSGTLRRYGARLLAAHWAPTVGFADIVVRLRDHLPLGEAIEVAMRAKRGLVDTSEVGGVTRDQVYLRGLRRLEVVARQDPKAPELLLSAKVGFDGLPMLRLLAAEGVVGAPNWTPDSVLEVAGRLSG